MIHVLIVGLEALVAFHDSIADLLSLRWQPWSWLNRLTPILVDGTIRLPPHPSSLTNLDYVATPLISS